MLKFAWAAFAVACFWGLSDIHERSGHLQMAPHSLDKQTTGCNSPHHWLMSLPMNLAALCGTYGTNHPQLKRSTRVTRVE